MYNSDQGQGKLSFQELISAFWGNLECNAQSASMRIERELNFAEDAE